ncbi:hypothetical protein TrLO_g2626 [Triparma laevis f. longispina]|uniref:Uncharacterized protein n=1 Tax=Triparma laevis f. longispina TaxID=1714387 RepID=A0A9W7FH96_9STRA|nr:hypothetical protein TrLO_g2626 [Triparma laevis f. longispina]
MKLHVATLLALLATANGFAPLMPSNRLTKSNTARSVLADPEAVSAKKAKLAKIEELKTKSANLLAPLQDGEYLIER